MYIYYYNQIYLKYYNTKDNNDEHNYYANHNNDIRINNKDNS